MDKHNMIYALTRILFRHKFLDLPQVPKDCCPAPLPQFWSLYVF